MVLAADSNPIFNMEVMDALCHWYIEHDKDGVSNGNGRRHQSYLYSRESERTFPMVFWP